MMTKLFNRIDEQGRFNGLEFHLDNTNVIEQRDTHGYSYLYCRQQYQAMGEVMGFDKSIFGYMLEHNNYASFIKRRD